MKVLKSTDKKLKSKMEKLAEKNESFSVADGDTIHSFKAKGNLSPEPVKEKKKRKNDPEKAKAAVQKFREKIKANPGQPSLSGSKITIDYCSEDLKKEWKEYVTQSGLPFAKALEELLHMAKWRTITRPEEYKIQ